MKKTIISGFQKSYINEIVRQNRLFDIAVCVYVDDDKSELPEFSLAIDRNELHSGKCIENTGTAHYDEYIIKATAPYITNAVTLFDRYDVHNNIAADERMRVFYTNVAFWMNTIKDNKVELLISREIAHFPYEYALYVACKISNISILMFDFLEHLKRTLCISSIENRLLEIASAPESSKKAAKETVSILKGSYDKVINNSYAPKMNTFTKKWSPISWIKYISRDIMSLLKNGIFADSPISILLSKKQYENHARPAHFSVRWYFFKLRITTYIYEKYYNRLSKGFDDSIFDKKKVIVFYANYQPERTTNPDGGYFFDILNAVKLIKSSLPDDYALVYKEHPHIFSPPYKDLFRGASFRSKRFYDQIKNLGIELVPLQKTSYATMHKSALTATINGTIVLESVANGKPAVMLGNFWIESLPGVTKIKSSDELREYLTKKHDNIRITEEEVTDALAFFHAASSEYMNLLNNSRSVRSMEDEVAMMLEHIKDKI